MLHKLMVEQIAAAARQLSGQADALAEAVQVFRLEAADGGVHVRDAVALRRAGRADRAAARAPAAAAA